MNFVFVEELGNNRVKSIVMLFYCSNKTDKIFVDEHTRLCFVCGTSEPPSETYQDQNL